MTVPATAVVALPLSTVESNLWDVSSWPAFLSGLRSARRASHERYVFTVGSGRSLHDTVVAVRWHARDHRFSWQAMDGPAWDGRLALQAVNGRRTRITLDRVIHPRSFWAGLATMLGGHTLDLDGDLGRLQDRLALLPRPVRPSRSSRDGSTPLTAGAAAGAGARPVDVPRPRVPQDAVGADVVGGADVVAGA